MVGKILQWIPVGMAQTALSVLWVLMALALLAQGGCSPTRVALSSYSPTETRSDGAVRLTTPPTGASDQNPAFSPDTAQLVFTRFEQGYNDGPAGLFLLDLGDDTVTRLTPEEDQDNVNLPGSAWNEVNNRILFASDRLEADDLWRIAPNGSDFSRITTHADSTWYIEPSWSPDGHWIVFEASQTGGSEDGRLSQIWKVRSDGTELTQLTDGTYDDRQPNWSPRGDRILFQRRSLPDGQWDIYTITLDGSGPYNVTTSPDIDETDASWSPDGGWIVYSSDNGESPVPNIFIIPAEGGASVRITHNTTHEDSAPSWSLDGQWIAFESRLSQAVDTPASLWRIALPSSVYLPLVLKNFATSGSPSLVEVNDFLYQLQNLDLTAIGETAYDLVVMDYSADGTAAGEFNAAQIATLKSSPGGEKIVLAYMSIGEAESYRFYWQDSWDANDDGQPDPGAPAWLDVVNPEWEGNYKVRYWDPGWQAVIYGDPDSYLDRIIEAGFDGVYLDIIDAYSYYEEQGRTTAAQEMTDFVAAIRTYARVRDPEFYIFPQNAPELADLIPAYINSVDGIAQEDIYYGYEEDDQPTPATVTAELEGYLDMFKNAGKLVLTIDYATTSVHVDDAYAKSQAKGYVPFVTVRDLDQLTVNPGHEPD